MSYFTSKPPADYSPRAEAIRMISGTALVAAAQQARGEAVTTQLEEDVDQEVLRVRIYIEQQSTLVSIPYLVVDRFLADLAVQRWVRTMMETAVADLQHR